MEFDHADNLTFSLSLTCSVQGGQNTYVFNIFSFLVFSNLKQEFIFSAKGLGFSFQCFTLPHEYPVHYCLIPLSLSTNWICAYQLFSAYQHDYDSLVDSYFEHFSNYFFTFNARSCFLYCYSFQSRSLFYLIMKI